MTSCSPLVTRSAILGSRVKSSAKTMAWAKTASATTRVMQSVLLIFFFFFFSDSLIFKECSSLPALLRIPPVLSQGNNVCSMWLTDFVLRDTHALLRLWTNHLPRFLLCIPDSTSHFSTDIIFTLSCYRILGGMDLSDNSAT